MPHSASGPYPASFRNLSLDEKKAEARRLQQDYIEQFVKMGRIVRPRLLVPCAAEYVVVGELHHKNQYIGLASADEATAAFNAVAQEQGIETRAVRMDCGSLLDVGSGAVGGPPIRTWTEDDRTAFAASYKDVPFSYQWESDTADADEWLGLICAARANMWSRQQRLDWKRDHNVYLNLDDDDALFHLNFNSPSVRHEPDSGVTRVKPYLECFLSRQLLHAIVTRKAHWNNAEGGLHIDFFRDPNLYVPEAFTLLSFFHCPQTNG